MGLRRWFWSLLARGEPPEFDPDEYVEVALVSVAESQLAVALLARHSIEAVPVEQSRYPGGANLAASVSIQVQRRDAEEAVRVVAEQV
jgi:hypothetical protein